MRHLLAFLFACCAAFAQAPVVVVNYSTLPTDAWTYVTLPESDMPAAEAGWMGSETVAFPWVREPHGVRVWCSVGAGQKLKLGWLPKGREVGGFAWHPVLEANALRVLPWWTLGDERCEPPALWVEHASAASVVVHMRTVFASRRVTVDCWLTATSNEPTVEFQLAATYGDTRNDGQPQSVVLPPLRLHSWARPHRDEWSRCGTGLAAWSEGTWTLPCTVDGQRWHRASRFVVRGALMPVDDFARMEGRPLVGMSLGWADKWLPFGVIPTPTVASMAELASRKAAWDRRIWGDYLQQRPRAQMPTSGTTGEQPDFGWASDWAVTAGEPWEILDGLWQCDSYAIRPTANKEPDGRPMQALSHPQAETLNQRPDLSWGQGDRLGWPGVNQIAWIPSPDTVPYTTEDDQHRSPMALAAMVALTRDPVLCSIVEDQIELDRTDFYVRRRVVPAARAIGRLALARACWVWLGYRQAEPVLRQCIDDALAGQQNATAAVPTIGPIEQAKYGWATAAGQPVMGWQPWQQMIAAGGIRAAWRVTGEDRYRIASEKLCETILSEAWRMRQGKAWHAYAVAYNNGLPMGEEDWPTTLNRDGEAWTDRVYVSSAAGSWTIGAAIVLPNHPASRPLLAAWPAPRTILESRWRALR